MSTQQITTKPIDRRTVVNRRAKAAALAIAPYEAMTDLELIREHHTGNRQMSFTVIMNRINSRLIPITYDGFDNGIDAAVAAFKAAA